VIGNTTLAAGYSRGRTNANLEVTGWLIGANVAVGVGEIRMGYGETTNDPAGVAPKVKTAQKVGIGYHYNFSKRTKVYATIARDSKAAISKDGYDVGIQHNF